MSLDLFVQVFHEGSPAGFTTDVIGSAIRAGISVRDDDWWQLSFDSGATCDLFLQTLSDDPDGIHCLTFHRPGNDEALWEAIWELLDLPGAVFHFPGCAGPVVRHREAVLAMPESMKAGMGPSRWVHDLAELRQTLVGIDQHT